MAIFQSTAAFYSRYRVPYPKGLVAKLKADANLGPGALVLDLATGPGRLALPLAPAARAVVAVDIEAEMLDEGRRLARAEGITNVEWIHASAEELAFAPNTVDSVTVGEALHRLDEGLLLGRVGRWLKDHACVALVGCFGVLHGDQAWQERLRHALSEWMHGRHEPSAGPRGRDHDTRQLLDAGFSGVVNRDFAQPFRWTHESILGHLHSTSRFSLSALGDERETFERVVTKALGNGDGGPFTQEVSCGYTVGWKGGPRP